MVGDLNLEAEGQARYPTLQNNGVDKTHFSLVLLFLWEGGFDRRSGRENSRADKEGWCPWVAVPRPARDALPTWEMFLGRRASV